VVGAAVEIAGAAGLGAAIMVAGCGALWGAAAGDCADAGLVVVSADEEAGGVVSCPIALSVTSREAAIIHFQVRMTQFLSVTTQYASWKTTCTVAVESMG